MKRWHYIALIGLGALGIVYIWPHRQEIGPAIPRSLGAIESTIDDQTSSSSGFVRSNWHSVDRSADGFKVDMPAEIREIQIPAYNEHGGADQVNMIFCNPDGETTYSVAWAEDPPVARVNDRNPEKILDMARDDALARTQTSLMSESKISVGNFSGRDFASRNAGGGVMNARLIYANPRVYMLVAAFPSAPARREQDVIRFFNSFILVSPPRPPGTPAQAPAPPANHD